MGAGHPIDSLVNVLPNGSTRVTLEFTDGSKLFFNDQRKFGWMKLIATPLVFEMPFLQKVGPEPLEDKFTWQVLKEALSHKQRSKLKPALLDQSVLAGLGNIYVDECLLLSKLHPLSLVGSLSDRQLQILTQNIKLVLQKSIDAGGSSSRNYVDVNGKKGNYLDGNYAYKRDGEACRICGTTIEKIKVAGRGTHFCPHCQPTPKEV